MTKPEVAVENFGLDNSLIVGGSKWDRGKFINKFKKQKCEKGNIC
jgi:hypothetical protein